MMTTQDFMFSVQCVFILWFLGLRRYILLLADISS